MARNGTTRRGGISFVKKLLIGYATTVTIVLVLQWSRQLTVGSPPADHHDAILPRLSAVDHTTGSSSSSSSSNNNNNRQPTAPIVTGGNTKGWNILNPLAIPPGQPENLPSIRVQEPEIDAQRRIYGGAGDKKHLGGFTEIDLAGISPMVWKLMVEKYGVHSVLDVGCGRGISTSWFRTHGVDSLCVEGSHDAVKQSFLPPELVVEHDFTRGPWWPEDTYSACWAVEFLEHVNMQYQFNYLTAFRKCALIFATSSIWGGWHHVEVHEHDWWVQKFESIGLRYQADLTKEVREEAHRERKLKIPSPNGEKYSASHVSQTMKVFMNPSVSSLPQHAGLFPELGCYNGRKDKQIVHRECGTGKDGHLETPLPPEFHPIKLTPEMDAEFDQIIKENIPYKDKYPKPKDEAQKPADSRTTLSSLDPHQHPLMLYRKGELSLSEMPSLPVAVWPYLEVGIGNAESLHVEENGITESRHLYLSDSLLNLTDPNVIWVGDTGYAFGWKDWCDAFNKHVKKAKEKRKELGLPLSWPIFVVDFTDGPTNQRCPQVEKEIGREFVRYSTRSVVQGRYWLESLDWVKHGKRLSNTTKDGTEYLHTPLVVRTDTVRSIEQVLKEKHGMPLSGPIEELEREWDVSHFWPTDGKNVGTTKSNLRHKVSELLEEIGATENKKVYVGLAGAAVRIGRRGVQNVYIEHLLDSKIVLVTQRDAWEDHYRLFEALVTGPLVITDKMLSLPKGLKNGTSVVEAESAEDMRAKILYYLEHDDERKAIARKGRLVAMAQHRTWHRIEDIVFGAPVTKCNGSHCPFIVHAKEAFRRRRHRR